MANLTQPRGLMCRRTTGAAAIVAAALLSAPVLPRPALLAGAADSDAPHREERRAPATLRVWSDGRWQAWWSSETAPRRWSQPHPVVAGAAAWARVRPGLDVALLPFSGDREAWRFNVVLLRIDPGQLELGLHVKRGAKGRALPWSVDDVPEDAALAVNAGMFDALGPWGWIVLDGQERQAPGRGPLSSALVIDSAGQARIVTADSIAAFRSTGRARWAVQSYPTALHGDGDVPAPLHADGGGVNRDHRDARLAIGMLRTGHVLIALTRFDGLGGALDMLPFGPTLPEMTAILGALGARQAVFLDGGISAQMAVRHQNGAVQRWSGLRGVPLALAGRAR